MAAIIRVFFERGAFDADTTAMTAQALFFYSVGLWAFSGIRVMVSAFYALQDTRTPVKIAVATVVGLSHQTSLGTQSKNSKAARMP